MIPMTVWSVECNLTVATRVSSLTSHSSDTKLHDFCSGWKLPVHVSIKLFFSLFGMSTYVSSDSGARP